MDHIILTADAILAANDMTPEFVPCPEWYGGKEQGGVFIRGLTVDEHDVWERGNFQIQGGAAVFTGERKRARLLALCVCDEKGNAIFSEAQAEALGRKCAAPAERLYDRARALSGLKD